MKRFVLGVLASGLVLVIVFVLAKLDDATCRAANFRVTSFKICMSDLQAKCFVTPDHVRAYSRALYYMREHPDCEQWPFEVEEE